MAIPQPRSYRPAHRRPADHPRLRAAARLLHVAGAVGVPRAEHVHDVPDDAAAAGPARDRAHLRDRRRRDRPLLPVGDRLLRLRLRGALQGVQLGWFAVVAAIASGVLVGFVNGMLIAKVGIPSFIATLGTQFFWTGMAAVLSGGKSYALRGAEAIVGLASHRRPPVRRARQLRLAEPDLGVAALDRRDLHLPVVRPEPPPLRRARALHRRFQCRIAGRRHRRRAREDQALHADGHARLDRRRSS